MIMKRPLVRLCLTAIMGVLLTVSKEAMAFLPNFEPVTLLTILFTLVFGSTALGAVGVFLMLEGLLYGFGLWWIMYLYIWPLLALLVLLLRRLKWNHAWQWALIAGGFGLLFGSLCSLVYLPMGGPKTMVTWALAGLPFDAVHAGGNFLLMLVLYHPLRRVLELLRRTSGC